MKSFLTSLRSKLLVRRERKYSDIQVQIYAFRIVSTRVRVRFKYPFIGKDKALDEKLFEILKDFFEPTLESRTSVSDSDIDREEILKWVESDHESNEARKMHLRVSHWQALEADEEDKAHAIDSAYQSFYGERLKPVDSVDFRKIKSDFRKKFEDEDNVFRKSRIKLIELPLQRLTLLLPWVSLLLILTGYVHTYFVYGRFGIDVDQFFSLNDYLASTIEEITSVFFHMVCALITAIGFYRNERAWELYKSGRGRIAWLLYVLSVFLLFDLVFMGNIRPGPLYGTVSVSAIVVTRRPVFYLVRRYFKKPTGISIVLMILIGFFSGIAFRAYSQISEIEQGRPGMEFEIETPTRKFTHENFTFIGGNSRYIFLRTEGRGVEIIPVESTARIKILTVEKISDKEEKEK